MAKNKGFDSDDWRLVFEELERHGEQVQIFDYGGQVRTSIGIPPIQPIPPMPPMPPMPPYGRFVHQESSRESTEAFKRRAKQEFTRARDGQRRKASRAVDPGLNKRDADTVRDQGALSAARPGPLPTCEELEGTCTRPGPVVLPDKLHRCAEHAAIVIAGQRGDIAARPAYYALVHRDPALSMTFKHGWPEVTSDAGAVQTLIESELDAFAREVVDTAERKERELIEKARRKEATARESVLATQAEISEWPRDRTMMIRLRLSMWFALALAVSLVANGLWFVTPLPIIVVFVLATSMPMAHGATKGTRRALKGLRMRWEAHVQEHGLALNRLRMAELSVPPHIAFPELHPERPELPQ